MKIKRIIKYILPIVIVVGVVVYFLVTRTKKPTGRDNVLTGNIEATQDASGNYISQRYASNLIPSGTGLTVDGEPVDNVIRVDNGESGEDSDYILVEIEEQDIKELFKKEDLLGGHPTTNHIKEITEEMKTTTDIVYRPEGTPISDADPFLGMPTAVAYDTEIVDRTFNGANYYIGMLYGRWTYCIEEELKEKYNITTELVIASHYSGIVLEERQLDATTEQVVLANGFISVLAYLE